ncbi:MAG: histidinol-phosphatase HisJ family protein [Anaerolineae bacterium]|nr:histidinol-phosphatase HisJ family protein [Anaerolineae bacterium]
MKDVLGRIPDYHIHTKFSCDSETAMVTACDMASLRGLNEIAFADHADFEPLDECCGYLRPDDYLAEIRRCMIAYGDILTIRAGVEIGEGHIYKQEAAELLRRPFDFVFASLHWVNGRPAFDARYFADQSLEEGLRAYFEELAKLAARADYDVLAHFDLVRRAVYRVYGLGTLDYTAYEELIRHTLKTVAKRGKGIEINTSNCWKGMGDPNPTLQVLQWYREEGGEVLIFGSDAHRYDAIGLDFDVALDMARTAGFKRLSRFERRRVSWIDI